MPEAHDHPKDYQLPENYNPGGSYPPDVDVNKHPDATPEARAGHFPYRGTEQHGVPMTTEQPDQLQDSHIDTVPQRTRPTGEDHNPLAVKIKQDDTPTQEIHTRVRVVQASASAWTPLLQRNPRRISALVNNLGSGLLVSNDPNPVDGLCPTISATANYWWLIRGVNALYMKAASADHEVNVIEEFWVDI
jgi:hypothetical protein